MTNGDKIRSMNDEELTNFLYEWMHQNIKAYLETFGRGCTVDIKKCIMESVNENEEH